MPVPTDGWVETVLTLTSDPVTSVTADKWEKEKEKNVEWSSSHFLYFLSILLGLFWK